MKIAFIGGGNMARAIIGGLVARGTSATDIGVVEPESLARLALVSDFGVATYEKPGRFPGAGAYRAYSLREAPADARGRDRRGARTWRERS